MSEFCPDYGALTVDLGVPGADTTGWFELSDVPIYSTDGTMTIKRIQYRVIGRTDREQPIIIAREIPWAIPRAAARFGEMVWE